MTELDKAYDHTQVEEKIYKIWEDSGFFNPDKLPDAEKREPFTISLPPPNVTGMLHLGHAFEDTIQDTVTRYQRMKGKRALWLPGTDHAAIATQAKFEKEHYKATGKSRHDYSRQDFFDMIQKFALKNQQNILSQLHKLGLSLDWSRLAFTLDKDRELAVSIAFKEMYEAGLIYRGYRVVNWDVKGQTTVSDDEIEHEETKAKFYTFRYAKNFPISIATTRPETKLGDAAVAVNPEDTRYQQYIGQEFDLEFCGNPLHIKIIADKEVDPDFGTGALGVTPLHSMIDFELAQRHNLTGKQIINEVGKMMAGGPELEGQKTLAARQIIVDKLKQAGLLEKEEEINQNLSKAQRTGGVIEPLPKLQWFINVNKKFTAKSDKLAGIKQGEEVTLKEVMQRVVEKGQIKIMPERFEKIYYHWIDNLRDWCISRQIIYGHQIPVWYDNKEGLHLPKQRKIIFVRHGQSTGNASKIFTGQQDHDLTDLGAQQAKETAALLKKYNFNTILSSDLQRAHKTAKIIASELGKEKIVLHQEFREVYAGELETKPSEFGGILVLALEKNIGETAEELVERAKQAWKIIDSHESDETIVVVGHNSFFSVMTAVRSEIVTKQGLIDFRKKWHMPNAGIYEFSILTNPKGEKLTQDTDTLDTWFSSGLWTFSTLGWPNNTLDLKTFHPTSVMMPGYEILFFWVARMILMSGFLLADIPFRQVYLHGIVRDNQGRKFSKSLNNGIDPLEIIAKYGTDALRMALVFGAAPGNDVIFDEQKVKGMKHFANKLWNIARFVLANPEESDIRHQTSRPEALTDADKEILAKLDQTIKNATTDLEAFRLHEAAQEIYQFTWHEFADIYIEKSKEQLKDEKLRQNTLATCYLLLATVLKLLHPFMPFVTEEIWSKLNQKQLLMITDWPK